VIVWQLCNGENSVGEIISMLKEAYPDQAEQIEGDVVAVVQELAEKEAILVVKR